MNIIKPNPKIKRRKFLAISLSSAALTSVAILLGKNDALAHSLSGVRVAEWQITVHEKVIKEGKFTDKKEEFYIPVKNGNAHIVIDNRRIFVHEDSEICERKICAKMGSISESGESITCKPNKLVVRIF